MKNKIITLLLLTGTLFCAAGGKLELVPGYEVCSIYLPGCEAETEAELQAVLKYRREGETQWKTAADALVYLPKEKELRGSLLELSEGTGYRIQLECLIGGQKKSFPGKFRTRTPKVPVAKTIVLDEKTPMPMRISRSGSPEGWIRYTMKPGAVLDGGDGGDDAEYCFSKKLMRRLRVGVRAACGYPAYPDHSQKGVIARLNQMGIKENDTVVVGDVEFDFVP